MPLRVIQLGPVPPPEGGITRNIAAITSELANRGHISTVIATSKSSEVRERQDVHHPRTARALLSLLRKIDADILHLHVGGDMTKRVLLMALACTLFGKGKSVLTLHSGGLASSHEGGKATPVSFAGYVFRRFSKVIAVNDELAALFKRLGVLAERIDVILPFALTQPDESVKMPDDLAEFCSTHSPLLVSVGGWEQDYEPVLQIETFNDVRTDFPKAGLVIVGGGSMRKQVEAAAANSHSVMLAGPREHDAVLHLIKRADAMLRITLFDGDAISVREALFLGTPVIATDNGMRPEGVRLVPISDRNALAAAIRDVVAKGKPPADVLSADNTNIRKVADLYESLAKKA